MALAEARRKEPTIRPKLISNNYFNKKFNRLNKKK